MSDSLQHQSSPVAHQALLSKGFSRQEYWSRSPCPPPGDLPDPQIEPMFLRSPALAGGFFTTLAKCVFDKCLLLVILYFPPVKVPPEAESSPIPSSSQILLVSFHIFMLINLKEAFYRIILLTFLGNLCSVHLKK